MQSRPVLVDGIATYPFRRAEGLELLDVAMAPGSFPLMLWATGTFLPRNCGTFGWSCRCRE